MKKKIPKKHVVDSILVDGRHDISIIVVGCGGTGAHVLTNLAMINASLKELGKRQIQLSAFDDDVVMPHNVGRQLFSPADIGRNKAECIIERINRYYGIAWAAVPEKYGTHKDYRAGAAITFSCVDSMSSRIDIIQQLKRASNYLGGGSRPLYLIDIGNDRYAGQVFLSTVIKIKQPNKREYIDELPNIIDEYPKLIDKKEDKTDSCSAAESLTRQDLFINKMLATYATTIFWHMIRNFVTSYRGVYVNLSTYESKAIHV